MLTFNYVYVLTVPFFHVYYSRDNQIQCHHVVARTSQSFEAEVVSRVQAQRWWSSKYHHKSPNFSTMFWTGILRFSDSKSWPKSDRWFSLASSFSDALTSSIHSTAMKRHSEHGWQSSNKIIIAQTLTITVPMQLTSCRYIKNLRSWNI